MEISERELRQLTRDVDASHRDGMATMAADLRELHAAARTATTSRRDLIRKAGAGAGVLTIGAAVVPIAGILPAAAQTTAAKLSDDDVAAFAQSIELVAVEAYKAAAATGKLSKPALDTGTLFASHHTEHAAAFAGIAGSKASNKANPPLLSALSGQLQNARDEKTILQIAFDLEGAAAATYLFALGAFEGTSALKLAASILPVESQHQVVLGQALGKTFSTDAAKPPDHVPTFENQDRAIDPTKFPVTTTTSTTTTIKK